MSEKTKSTFVLLKKAARFCKTSAKLNADRLLCAATAFALGLTPAGGLYPFGWAFFLACDRYGTLLLCTLWLCSLINGSLAAGVILGTGIYAFKKLSRSGRRKPLLKMAAALFCALFLCAATPESGAYGIAVSLIGASLLPLFTLLYGMYAQGPQSAARNASLAAFFFTFTLFLKSAFPSPVPARSAALLVTLLAASEGGMLYGGFFGFVCGMAVDAATGAMFGVCGLASGLLFAASRYLAVSAGCLAGLCTGLYFLGADSVPKLILCFILGVSALFMLKGRLKLLSLSNGSAGKSEKALGALPLSEAFFAISRFARVSSGGASGETRAADDYENFSRLLSEAKEMREADEETDEQLSAAAAHLLSGAGVRAENVRVSGSRKKRLEAENVVIDALSMSSDALSQLVSKLLGAKMRPPEFYLESGKAALYMESAPAFRIECSRTGVCKRGERISGDSISFFSGKDGLFFALISDGMGSGKEAALSSRLACLFLEKLLSAGASRRSALSLLNSYLTSRNCEVFATVDLFEADLYTGRGVLVKAGAPPSFVLRNGKIRRLQSATAPAGIIREIRAEQLSFPLRHGDLLFMLSDGVSCDGDDGAEKLLSGLRADGSTADMANALLEDAVRRTGKHDDMSVCVIKVLNAA